MKRTLFLLLLLFFVTSTVSAKVIATITLKNGSVFEGAMIEENNQIVRLEFANRDIRVFYKSDIASISTSEQTQAERRELQRLHGRGYHQFVNLSYSYCSVTDFLGVNYIGGYRFNHLFFLGLGVGADFALFTPQMEQKYANAKPTRVNIPVYLNFRTNFSDKAWSPYISVSAGARISPAVQELDEYTYNQSGVLGDVSFGVERRLGQKSSLYLGIGYRIESFLGVIPMYYRGNIEDFQFETGVLHGFNVHIGVSF